LGEKFKARVLTKAQQVIRDFWIMDDAKLLHICLDGMGLANNKKYYYNKKIYNNNNNDKNII